jgi:hypothetical protein
VEAFTKAFTQFADGVLADVVRVRNAIQESFSKVLCTYMLFVVLLLLKSALNMCALILIFKLPLLIFCFNLFWQLLPKLKDLYVKIVDLSIAVSNAALETASKVILKLFDLVKEHEGEIKKIAQAVQEFVEGKVTFCLTHHTFCCTVFFSSLYT